MIGEFEVFLESTTIGNVKFTKHIKGREMSFSLVHPTQCR